MASTHPKGTVCDHRYLSMKNFTLHTSAYLKPLTKIFPEKRARKQRGKNGQTARKEMERSGEQSRSEARLMIPKAEQMEMGD